MAALALFLLLLPLASAHFSVTYPWWRGNSFATQYEYPCGGVNQTISSTNRTLWPLTGGAIAFKPTHPWAQTYINIGLGSEVSSLNITLASPFNQTGNGTFCIPTLALGWVPKEGDLATVQVVQLGARGSALYNCADIEFSEKAVGPGTEVCFNSSGVSASVLDYGNVATVSGGAATAAATGSGAGGKAWVSGSLVGLAGAVAVFMV